MREIEFIPQKVFTIDREGNTIFNRNNFIGCDSWDLECLESFLSEQLCSYINVYTIHRDSLDYGYYPMCNSYIDPVMRDQEVIIDYLKSNKQLIPQIISWLDIYNANKDKVLGDVINGGYQKRK